MLRSSVTEFRGRRSWSQRLMKLVGRFSSGEPFISHRGSFCMAHKILQNDSCIGVRRRGDWESAARDGGRARRLGSGRSSGCHIWVSVRRCCGLFPESRTRGSRLPCGARLPDDYFTVQSPTHPATRPPPSPAPPSSLAHFPVSPYAAPAKMRSKFKDEHPFGTRGASPC